MDRPFKKEDAELEIFGPVLAFISMDSLLLSLDTTAGFQ